MAHSDPPRWKQAPPDAPRRAPEALRALRKRPVLSDAVRARSAARVAAMVAGGGAAPARPLVRARWLRLIVGSVVVVSSALVVRTLATRKARPAAPAVASHAHVTPQREARAPQAPSLAGAAPSATAVAPPAASVVAARESAGASAGATPLVRASDPAAAVTRPARAEHAAPSARPAGASNETPTGDELSALRGAVAALDAADPARALRLADAMAQAFPRGQYVEERERVAIRALHALGRREALQTRGRAYLARFPHGLYAAPVRRLLDGGGS